MRRSARRVRRVVLALLCVGASGCAYGLVQGGGIRRPVFDTVLARTMYARQLYLDEPPRVEVATPESLEVVLEQALDDFYTPEMLADSQTGLVAVGLWPPDRDLRSEFVKVFSGEVAGLYVPSRETIYVVDGTPRPLLLRVLSFVSQRDILGEFVLSHEIVHLLQHRAHPELLDPAQQRADQDDLDNAVQAAIEGDALRYGYEAIGVSTASISGDEFAESVEAESGSSSEALRDAPALLRLTLTFPYVAGFPLALAEGRDLLEQPPASTEQALHGIRRFEPFAVFDLRPLRSELPTGCEFVHENTVGELHLSVLFRDLSDAPPSPEVWLGWDGDRYLAARCAGALELLWISSWDEEHDAEEFAAAYTRLAPAVAARAGYAVPPVARRDGLEVVVSTPGLADLAGHISSLASRGRVSGALELKAFYDGAPPP